MESGKLRTEAGRVQARGTFNGVAVLCIPPKIYTPPSVCVFVVFFQCRSSFCDKLIKKNLTDSF